MACGWCRLWTAEEDAELAQLVHEHGVIGAWDDIAKMFSVERTGNALSKRWSKIKEQWEDADSAAAAATAARRKKDRENQVVAPSKDRQNQVLEEDDGLTDEEWLAASDVGSDVEVRDRQSWYACKIVEAEEKRCKIHFVGCGRRYDRWVTRSSDFLRRLSPQLDESSEEEDDYMSSDEEQGEKSAGGDVDRTVWTHEEDAELARLVHKHGAGNWSAMGSEFSSGRSSNALRNRWMRLERQGGADLYRQKEAEDHGSWTLAEVSASLIYQSPACSSDLLTIFYCCAGSRAGGGGAQDGAA